MTRRLLFRIAAAVIFGLSAFPALAAEYKLEKAGDAPEELAPAIREALSPEGWRVTGPDGPFCEVWLRKVIPAKSNAPDHLGVAFTQLTEGTLLGAIRFHATATDYRRVKVKPGVYTMRYMIHPMDGNHLGVAPQRDFIILGQAAGDTNLVAVTGNDLLGLGREASGISHPTVWRLDATDSGPPSLIHMEEEDHWVLRFEVTLQPEGGAPAKKGMGIVVSGSAEA